MNKTELVKAMVNECDYDVTQACAEDLLNTFMDIVKREVAAGNKVQLIGFGTFEPAERAERKGKNPQTGEEMTIAACTVPKFKPGKAFKDAVK
jgi:DNA-binding protein HU-beta